MSKIIEIDEYVDSLPIKILKIKTNWLFRICCLL